MTLHVVRLLEHLGLNFRAYSTSPKLNTRASAYHISRIVAVLRIAIGILLAPKETTVYLSIAGGWGLIYDVMLVAVSRFRNFEIVAHHHSFAYLNKPSQIFRTLVRLASHRQTHIVLCSRMAELLQATYPLAQNIKIVSNGAFSNLKGTASVRKGALTRIGLLSNITREKGVDLFIALVEHLEEMGWQGEAVIAGPVPDPQLRTFILDRVRSLRVLSYVGPVYDEERSRFLSSLDLMIFPTRYVNEAEPLVVLEAQEMGVAVAASNRGCIAEMIDGADGLLLDPEASNIIALSSHIVNLTNDADAMDALRNRVLRAVRQRDRKNALAHEKIVAIFQSHRHETARS